MNLSLNPFKLTRLAVAAVAVAGIIAGVSALGGSAAHADPAYGPDTCKDGYVWREAFADDHVCVLPEVRSRTRAENQQPSANRAGGGAHGPDTCKQGHVWRETRPGDHVCVSYRSRDDAKRDNGQNVFRLEAPQLARQGAISLLTVNRALYVEGSGFSPDGYVRFFYVTDSLGSARAVHIESIPSGGGAFARQYLGDGGCVRNNGPTTTIVAVDSRSGRVVKAGVTTAYHC